MKTFLPLLAIAVVTTAVAEVEYEIHSKNFICEIVGRAEFKKVDWPGRAFTELFLS